MGYETLNGWYNYKTKEYDYLPVSASLSFTDEQARQYISQSASAQNIYDLLRNKMGMSVQDSMLKVLKAMVGDK